jgi:S1-C subfamily serine protease
VQVNGSALDAGIQQGDVISEIDGTPVKEPIAVFTSLREKRADDYIILKVIRSGKPISVTYKLMSRSE